MNASVTHLAEASAAARLAGGLYRERLGWAFHGRIRRDPLARLRLAPGRADPYSIYAELRRRGPMVPSRLGNWITTSHTVANDVLRSRTFGVRPDDGPQPPPGDFDLSFLDRNDPDHARLRRVAAPAFSPRMMEVYGRTIDGLVEELVAALGTRREVDLVAEFAAPLPIRVITALFGIDESAGIDTAAFARYGAAIGGSLDGIRSLRHARELMAADAALGEMFEQLFVAREREPRDDLVSLLVAERGDRIAPAELVPMCMLLLVAGFETTVNLIGNAVVALQQHPDQWALLTEDPGRAADAVEETLRWNPPVQRTERVSFVDQEAGGVVVRRDQWVALLLGATGRDPEVFLDPDTFDITRAPVVEHLAFSSGIHYCLGSPLARLEARRALAALATRLPRLRLAGRVTLRPTSVIRGPLHIPVTTG